MHLILFGMPTTYKIVGAHLAAWLLYVLILLLGADKTDFRFWTNTISTIIPIITFFYLNIFFLFPKYLQRRKYVPLTVLLILFNFSTISLRLVLVMLFNQKGINSLVEGFVSPVIFWNQFRVNLLFIGISFAYWFAQRNYWTEKNQQILEREISDARLNSLKNQINPHFLYNTLSLIYTKSLACSEELASAIAKLSDMMRYSLEDIEADGKVALQKEVTHINNFIEIQQLRFNNKLSVSFDITGDLYGCRIMPLLLITFVENAFKHGDLNDKLLPLKIRLGVSGQYMTFEINNKKAGWKKEPAHGIGLQNVRNRLELAYPSKHELTIRDAAEHFAVNLKINFTK